MSEQNSNESIHYETLDNNDNNKGEDGEIDGIEEEKHEKMKEIEEKEQLQEDIGGTPIQEEQTEEDNFDGIDNSKKYNNDDVTNDRPELSIIKTKPSFKEQQAASLAFSKMMGDQYHSSGVMDKEKWFETFLLFQNFINMNQAITSPQFINSNRSNLNKNITDNNIISSDEATNRAIPEQIKPIEINNTEDPSNVRQKANDYSENDHENNDNHNNQALKKYDEIPIKPTNINFLELLEKELANDSTALHQPSTGNGSTIPKKRTNLSPSTHQKRARNISKPSKKDKKYTYYTDFLDDQGLIKDEKVHRIPPTTKLITSNANDSPNNNPLNLWATNYNNSSSNNTTQAVQWKSEENITIINQPVNESPDSEHEEQPWEWDKIEKVDDNNNKLYPYNNNTTIIDTKQEIIMNSETCNNDFKPQEHLVAENEQVTKSKVVIEGNMEVVKSKEEDDKINKLKNEYEKNNKHLQDNIEKFNTKKKEFEKWREEEMKKLEKEKKNIQQDIKQFNILKQQNQSLLLKSKRDKETIEFLKNQILKIQNENKIKDQNTKIMLEKLKKEIDELTRKMNRGNWMRDTHNESPVNGNDNKPSSKTRDKSKYQSSNQENNFKSTSGNVTKKQVKPGKDNNLMYGSWNDGLEMGKRINKNIWNNGTKPSLDKLTKNNTFSNSSTKNKGNFQNMTKPKIMLSYTNASSSLGVKPPSNLTQVQGYQRPKRPGITSPNKQAKLINNNTTQLQTSPQMGNNKNNNTSNKTNKPNKKEHPEFSKEEFDFIFPEKYHQIEYELIKSLTSNEGKVINLYTNNKREVIFQSGVKKEIYEDGYQIVYFTNGDWKQIFPTGKSVYFFKEAKTVQSTFSDGLQVFKFQNGQIEKHFPDGSKQIAFLDGSFRYITSDGYEETHYADGTIQTMSRDNVVAPEYPEEK